MIATCKKKFRCGCGLLQRTDVGMGLCFFLLFCTVSAFAQYDTIMDPRSGKPVRYAGKFQAKPLVIVPRGPQFSVQRFRGVWVATVMNLDMPRCATADQFKASFRRIADNLQRIRATALIFQVRPMNDAFYPSALNPYSRYMSGTEGAGFGSFDPLKFMIGETHRRGMEFHAWLNPYRASAVVPSKKVWLNSLPSGHFARRNPEAVLCVPAGKNGYRMVLDPGHPKTLSFFNETVREIVVKYSVDAIHLDDYFYPYEDVGNADYSSFKRYNPKRLSLADWRRSNVNTMIRTVSSTIRVCSRKTGRRIRFGVSPFGIWANRKTFSSGSLTGGMESYSRLFADSRLWIKNRWIDYVAPQLYWTFGHDNAAYAALVDWWAMTVRGTGVQLYPGLSMANVGSNQEWSNPDEIYNQLRYNLRHREISGSIIYSYSRVFSPGNKTMRQSALKLIQSWRNSK